MSSARTELRDLLGSEYSVQGTGKLNVYGPSGTTAGTYDPEKQEVWGFAEVEIYGYDDRSMDELGEMGRSTIEEHLESIGERGFELDLEAASVDPLGLSELTGGSSGPDYLYVVDIYQKVDSVEEAAEVLKRLDEHEFNFQISEE